MLHYLAFLHHHLWSKRNHGCVALPRMTDRVHLSNDGGSVYHTCGATPPPAVIDRYFVKHCYLHWMPPLIFIARYWCRHYVCLSVCPPVRHVPVFYGNGLTLSYFLHHTVAQSFNSHYKLRIGTPNVSNGISLNVLKWPLTLISRSRHYVTSNNSKMVQERLAHKNIIRLEI